jgi:DNA polymerase (family 10)
MALGADGLRERDRTVAAAREEDIYRALGLQWIAPELREGRGEIELAGEGGLPDLVRDADIRGILHAHTVDSDGTATVEEMAEATRAGGYEYFGIADHSRSAGYAGGLSIAEVERQHEEIDRLNESYRGAFRIFKGIESDILADGELDYPPEILSRFDFVVASIHGRFRMDREAQTERMMRAVANPFTTIVGHMTGRQLMRRRGYEIDIDRILSACAVHGVAVEINAHPWRLDLDWRWHGRALELGCNFAINPDAHSTAELDLLHWGVVQARKGGIPRERIINCLDRESFAAYLRNRRG